MHLPWLEGQSIGITAGKASAKCLISVALYRDLFHISAQCQCPHITRIRPERQLTLLPEPQSIPPKHSYSSLGGNADRICRTLHKSHRRQRPHSPLNHPRLYKKIPLPDWAWSRFAHQLPFTVLMASSSPKALARNGTFPKHPECAAAPSCEHSLYRHWQRNEGRWVFTRNCNRRWNASGYLWHKRRPLSHLHM